MTSKHYLWILPFISFLIGYQLLAFLTVTKDFPNPSLIGLPLTKAIKILSDQTLNPRIMAEKEEPDLPEGTILSQTPAPHKRVKPNQPIFLVVSKKPQLIPAPYLVGKTLNEIHFTLNQHGLRSKLYELTAPAPQGTCIGQSPDTQRPVEHKKMIAYISAGKNSLMLFPNLKGARMDDVIQCLSTYNVTTKIFHTHEPEPEHQCSNCTVIDHKPLPGSIVDVRKPVFVQLQVNN